MDGLNFKRENFAEITDAEKDPAFWDAKIKEHDASGDAHEGLQRACSLLVKMHADKAD